MNRGFLNSLFDFSFNEFVTPKVISFIYIVGVAFAALGLLISIIGSFIADVATGLVVLLISPFIFLLWVIMFRVYLEVIIILFKIYAGIRALRPTSPDYDRPPSPGRPSKLDIDL